MISAAMYRSSDHDIVDHAQAGIVCGRSIRADERSKLDVADERGLFAVGGETVGGGHRLAVPHLAGFPSCSCSLRDTSLALDRAKNWG